MAIDYGGRTLKVNLASQKPDGKGKGKDGKGKGKDGKGKGRGNNELTVCVRGLPWSVREDGFKKDFAECGEIVSCRLLLNDEGQPKGIAFVEYSNEEGLKKACEFNETDYGGRTIYVSPAGEGGGKGDGKGKGKEGKGKGKDGKGKGKDGKGKGKGKKGGMSSEKKAAKDGSMGTFEGKKVSFGSDDDDDEKPAKKKAKTAAESDDEE